MNSETIQDLIDQVQTDMGELQEIVDRWTGFDESLKTLRLEIESLSDELTNL